MSVSSVASTTMFAVAPSTALALNAAAHTDELQSHSEPAVTVVSSVPAPATPLAVRFNVTVKLAPAAPSVTDVVPALIATVALSLSVTLTVHVPPPSLHDALPIS